MLKNTDAISKHFKSKLIKSYSNHHGKVRARLPFGLLFSKKIPSYGNNQECLDLEQKSP